MIVWDNIVTELNSLANMKSVRYRPLLRACRHPIQLASEGISQDIEIPKSQITPAKRGNGRR